ncbi:MAG: hypothetical protein IJ147_10275 [Lachnospiraceae bacterium]|nr:hypothetical protein [Lachnospiraceae bacterium]MBQ8118426.1 hypothetical protein [Lachnospiraceae bacterium]
MRIWIKLWQNGHMIKDTTEEDLSDDTRTHKVFHILDTACHKFDLAQPIWLDKNIAEFKRHARTRFYQDSFIESVDFDYMEFQVLEEDRSY